MSKLKNKKGFTLIELIATLAIIGILFTMLASIVSYFSKFNSDENSALDNQRNMRLLVVQLEKDIRMSDQTFISDSAVNCNTIGTDDINARKTEYCFNATTQVVTRNGVVIAKDIVGFGLSENGEVDQSGIIVDIESKQDNRGNTVSVSTTIYLRDGKGNGE